MAWKFDQGTNLRLDYLRKPGIFSQQPYKNALSIFENLMFLKA